jgi:hypothetical protein
MYKSLIFFTVVVAALSASSDVPHGAILLDETFTSSNPNNWATGTFGDGQRTFSLTNGRYVIETAGGARAWCSDCGSFGDGAFAIKGRIEKGGPESFWGIVFRLQPDATDSFYLFEVYNDRSYSFWRHDASGWTALVGKTRSSDVEAGDNLIAVVADGGMFDLYINGKYVTSAWDGSFASGYVGVYAAADDDNYVRATIDQISLYGLPAATPVVYTPTPGTAEVLFSDDFSDNSYGWTTGEAGEGARHYEIANGRYLITVRSSSGWNWCSAAGEFGDGVYEAVLHFTETGWSGDVGLAFRVQPDQTQNFYVVQIGMDGRVSLWRHGENDGWNALISPIELTGPLPGEDVTLGVVAAGGRFEVYVNGRMVGTAYDYSFSEGYAGFFGQVWEDDITEFAVDRFVVSSLSSGVEVAETPEDIRVVHVPDTTVIPDITPRTGRFVTTGRTEIVEVDGVAAGGGRDTPEQVLAVAKLNAQRAALEQINGTYLSSMSQTTNFQLDYDRVYAEFSGLVRVLEALSPRMTPFGTAGGFEYSVTLRLEVPVLEYVVGR